MKKLKVLAVVAVAAITSSCSMTYPIAASGAPSGDKVGQSSTIILFGWWQMNEDYGVVEAARVGGIKGSIAYVDEELVNYGVFMKKTLIVNGK